MHVIGRKSWGGLVDFDEFADLPEETATTAQTRGYRDARWRMQWLRTQPRRPNYGETWLCPIPGSADVDVRLRHESKSLDHPVVLIRRLPPGGKIVAHKEGIGSEKPEGLEWP